MLSSASDREGRPRVRPLLERDPDGSGLGLAIARQVVEHDSGTIELLDAPGGGVTARLVLRRAG